MAHENLYIWHIHAKMMSRKSHTTRLQKMFRFTFMIFYTSTLYMPFNYIWRSIYHKICFLPPLPLLTLPLISIDAKLTTNQPHTNSQIKENITMFFYLLALLHEISKLRVARAIKIIKLKFASRNNFSKCYSSLFCLPLLDFRFPCVCLCGGGFDVITLRLANRTH